MCFSIILSTLSIHVRADDYCESEEKTYESDSIIEKINNKIVVEINEKNKESSRYFKLDDSTEVAVEYLYECSEYNEVTGKYEQIDNTIHYDNGKYYNSNNKTFNVEFSIADKMPVVINEIRVGLYQGKYHKIRMFNPEMDSFDHFTNKSVSDEIIYEDVLFDTDVIYQLVGNSLEEYLVLNSNNSPSEIIYEFDKNTELFEENGIIVLKKGETRLYFTIC